MKNLAIFWAIFCLVVLFSDCAFSRLATKGMGIEKVVNWENIRDMFTEKHGFRGWEDLIPRWNGY